MGAAKQWKRAGKCLGQYPTYCHEKSDEKEHPLRWTLPHRLQSVAFSFPGGLPPLSNSKGLSLVLPGKGSTKCQEQTCSLSNNGSLTLCSGIDLLLPCAQSCSCSHSQRQGAALPPQDCLNPFRFCYSVVLEALASERCLRCTG